MDIYTRGEYTSEGDFVHLNLGIGETFIFSSFGDVPLATILVSVVKYSALVSKKGEIT